MAKIFTGYVKKPDGTAWANALCGIALVQVGTQTNAVFPNTSDHRNRTILQTDDDGKIANTTLETPSSGGWTYRLYLPDGSYHDAPISGDGTITVEEFIALAGTVTPTQGTLEWDWLGALYEEAGTAVSGNMAVWNSGQLVDAGYTPASLISDHVGLADPHTQYARNDGDALAGSYTITAPSSFTGGTYPMAVYVTPDSDTFPSPAAVFRNQNAPTGGAAQRYKGETHLWMIAGLANNERRYVNFRKYDNSRDDWIWGVNAGNGYLGKVQGVDSDYSAGDHILYDSRIHRFWFENYDHGNNSTNINAGGTGLVRFNYHQSDLTGGGVAIHSGAAAGKAFWTAKLVTARDINGEARVYMVSGQAYYHEFTNVAGDTTYWRVGKGNSNQWRVYNPVAGADAIWIASATNAITLGGNVSHSGYEVTNYGEAATAVSSSSGAIAFNATTANLFTVNMTENITSAPDITWPASADHASIMVEFTQTSAGNYSLSLSGMYPVGTEPDLSSYATGESVWILFWTKDGGTTEYVSLVGQVGSVIA